MTTTTADGVRPAAPSPGPPRGDFVHELVEAKSQTDPAIHEKITQAREAVSLASQVVLIVKRLRAVREDKRMTQADVAGKMGMTQSAVAKLEAGDHPPMWDSLERYAAAVGAQVSLDFKIVH
jgi:DNA-binding XRE family transcriptional regulator